MSHCFGVFTYSRPTYCDHCDKFLWGIVKQGCQCRDCGMNAHKKCFPMIQSSCPGVRPPGSNSTNQGHFDTRDAAGNSDEDEEDEESDDNTTYRNNNSSGSKSLAALSIDDHLLPSNTLRKRKPRSAVQQARAAPDTPLSVDTAPTTSGSTTPAAGSVFQELLATTAKESVSMKKTIKESAPPLNLLTTTPKNFTKFVSRVGPLADGFDAITDIMLWKEPSATIIAMLCFVILCIYPVLFLVMPQIALIFYITRLYYNKTKLEVVGKKAAGLSQPSMSETAAQYAKNMQFIQNQMGMFCDLHGEVSRLMKLIDWSNEAQTLAIIKGAAISAVAVVITVHLIPLNFIILVAGLGAFFSNTAFFRAASTTLPPVIMKGLADRVDSIRDGIAAARKAPEGCVITITLFENQRWWAGLGWIPHLLRSERSPWSDETGTISRPAKEAFELPANDPAGTWTWEDSDWRLDLGWSDKLDEGGWSYTDHMWKEPKAKASVGSLTRRRAWVRDMKMKPNAVIGGVAAVTEALSSATGVGR